jgi:hypothetical protein
VHSKGVPEMYSELQAGGVANSIVVKGGAPAVVPLWAAFAALGLNGGLTVRCETPRIASDVL